MIQVNVYRDRERRIYRVHVKGHAGFADYGQDIVCAAVSAIVIGMANATEELLGVCLHPPQVSEGDLDLRVPEQIEPDTAAQVRLLLEAMILSLRSVASEAPSHVRIEEDRKKD